MLYQSKNPHGGDVYETNITLDFSANTNPYGTPQGVMDAVTAALPRLSRYPDPYCRELVRALAVFEDVPATYILCGNGAAELIYSFCAALRPARAMELAPTFLDYSAALAHVGCVVERFPLQQATGFVLGESFINALMQQAPDVLFLCNPNNPTGQLLDEALLQRIIHTCQRIGTALFLDECFLDLSEGGESAKKYLATHPRLFILKAFTKSYGMAGVRLGYGLCADAGVLQRMAATVQSWNVSLLAQAAGIAALQENAFLQKTRQTVAVERAWLRTALEHLGFWVCPSAANFLLFRGSTNLHQALRAQGIAIRNCDNYPGLGSGWFRVAVRLHEENVALITALTTALQKV